MERGIHAAEVRDEGDIGDIMTSPADTIERALSAAAFVCASGADAVRCMLSSLLSPLSAGAGVEGATAEEEEEEEEAGGEGERKDLRFVSGEDAALCLRVGTTEAVVEDEADEEREGEAIMCSRGVKAAPAMMWLERGSASGSVFDSEFVVPSARRSRMECVAERYEC